MCSICLFLRIYIQKNQRSLLLKLCLQPWVFVGARRYRKLGNPFSSSATHSRIADEKVRKLSGLKSAPITTISELFRRQPNKGSFGYQNFCLRLCRIPSPPLQKPVVSASPSSDLILFLPSCGVISEGAEWLIFLAYRSTTSHELHHTLLWMDYFGAYLSLIFFAIVKISSV